MSKETIVFMGIQFRRYSKSKTRSEREYFTSNGTQRKKGIKRLHQEIWKYYNGKIPLGFAIHHKDGNSSNNDITNLECLSRGKHQSEHVRERFKDNEYYEKIKENLRKIQPLSHAWRKTDEGKKWHSEHAKKVLLLSKPKEFNCIECNIKAITQSRVGGKFCSKKCSSRWHSREYRKKK